MVTSAGSSKLRSGSPLSTSQSAGPKHGDHSSASCCTVVADQNLPSHTVGFTRLLQECDPEPGTRVGFCEAGPVLGRVILEDLAPETARSLA
jgi:hypothetical protein